MKLFIHTDPIRFEVGYEWGYGPCSEIVDMIFSFWGKNQELLFAYRELDRDKDEHKDEISEDLIEAFHADILYDEDGKMEKKIYEILVSSSYVTDPKITMEQLLTKFRTADLKNVDSSTKQQIKEALYKSYTIYELMDEPSETQSFINERIKSENSLWLSHYNKPDHLKRILWYKLSSREEVVKAIEINFWFSCMLVDQGAPLEEYNYFLTYTEEHGDIGEHDGMVLYIKTKKLIEFMDLVVPKLESTFGKIDIII
ncbi:hypothetical protein LBW89_00610 [Paenibacillus sp. alder61]|uniref:hypothetical protein n=1 Tax=Paenibacillus sp. alder61 TaxID=2862948 RepID=UPI001CD74623|nr:hypothetical protein [Paenibacillus sp. alder61]MCA1291512.1 hypothetical protein [Paenibacillus sp. alder61]